MQHALSELRRVLFSLARLLTRAYFFARLKRRERKSSVAHSLIVFKFYLRASIFNFLLRLRAASRQQEIICSELSSVLSLGSLPEIESKTMGSAAGKVCLFLVLSPNEETTGWEHLHMQLLHSAQLIRGELF